VEEWCDVDEREKQKYSFKKLRKKNFYKAILFSVPYFTHHTSQNEFKKPELLSATLHVDRNPLFLFCMDIIKYVLAQATDWCAAFLVRV
jgi:hypothetical protein